MITWRVLITLAHFIGLALALGAATVKVSLLIRCGSDPAYPSVYVQVVRRITRLIILGLILLTVSGVGWILLGFPLKPLLVAKIVLVVLVWIIGPIVDKVFEPRFLRLIPPPGSGPTAAFMRGWRQYLAMECVATGLFYVITVMGVLV